MLNDQHVPAPALLEELMADSAARHRHLCPRQVLGIRMGLYGLRLLGLGDDVYCARFHNEDKRLITIVETDGCGADGVAAATACYVGRRTLRVLDFGKMGATLIDTQPYRERNGRHQFMQGVRVFPSPDSRQLAGQHAPAAKSRWHAYLEAYQILPDESLLVARPVQLTQTLAQIMSQPGVRILCQDCGEEIFNEREVMVNGRSLCRACAGEGYYRRLAPASQDADSTDLS